jgi:hypothetical protein
VVIKIEAGAGRWAFFVVHLDFILVLLYFRFQSVMPNLLVSSGVIREAVPAP